MWCGSTRVTGNLILGQDTRAGKEFAVNWQGLHRIFPFSDDMDRHELSIHLEECKRG